MILYLSKEMPSGIVTTLHQLDSVSLRGNQLRCFFESYTAEDKLIAKKPASSQSFHFEVTDNELNGNAGLYEVILQKVQQTAEWENATLYTLTTVIAEQI